MREGDDVRIRDTLKNNWLRNVKVIGKHKSPRSYTVRIEDGNHLRNDRSHLLLKIDPYLNGNLDNEVNDCDHNESNINNTSPQNLGTNSYVTRYGGVIRKPVRFRDT